VGKKFIRTNFQIKITLLTACGADQAKLLDHNLGSAPLKPLLKADSRSAR